MHGAISHTSRHPPDVILHRSFTRPSTALAVIEGLETRLPILLLTSDACSLVVEVNKWRARVMSSDKPKNMGALGHLVFSACWKEVRDRETKWRKERRREVTERRDRETEEGKQKGGWDRVGKSG